MGVGVQDDVDILGWMRRRDVHETEADAIAFQIHYNRPFIIAVAIDAHQRQRRSEAFQPNDETWRANVTEMPDLIRTFGERFEILGQMVVRISEDKDPQRLRFHCNSHPERSAAARKPELTLLPRRLALTLRPCLSTTSDSLRKSLGELRRWVLP